MRIEISDEAFVEFERKQVGIGEIAIVVALLFRAHRTRLAARRIEQPRLLIDGAAVLDDPNLTARLDIDRLAEEVDGIEVFDVAARAKGRPGPGNRDVDFSAQIALLHGAGARADVAQDGAQL